jgi:hypothetical protein
MHDHVNILPHQPPPNHQADVNKTQLLTSQNQAFNQGKKQSFPLLGILQELSPQFWTFHSWEYQLQLFEINWFHNPVVKPGHEKHDQSLLRSFFGLLLGARTE